MPRFSSLWPLLAVRSSIGLAAALAGRAPNAVLHSLLSRFDVVAVSTSMKATVQEGVRYTPLSWILSDGGRGLAGFEDTREAVNPQQYVFEDRGEGLSNPYFAWASKCEVREDEVDCHGGAVSELLFDPSRWQTVSVELITVEDSVTRLAVIWNGELFASTDRSRVGLSMKYVESLISPDLGKFDQESRADIAFKDRMMLIRNEADWVPLQIGTGECVTGGQQPKTCAQGVDDSNIWRASVGKIDKWDGEEKLFSEIMRTTEEADPESAFLLNVDELRDVVEVKVSMLVDHVAPGTFYGALQWKFGDVLGFAGFRQDSETSVESKHRSWVFRQDGRENVAPENLSSPVEDAVCSTEGVLGYCKHKAENLWHLKQWYRFTLKVERVNSKSRVILLINDELTAEATVRGEFYVREFFSYLESSKRPVDAYSKMYIKNREVTHNDGSVSPIKKGRGHCVKWEGETQNKCFQELASDGSWRASAGTQDMTDTDEKTYEAILYEENQDGKPGLPKLWTKSSLVDENVLSVRTSVMVDEAAPGTFFSALHWDTGDEETRGMVGLQLSSVGVREVVFRQFGKDAQIADWGTMVCHEVETKTRVFCESTYETFRLNQWSTFEATFKPQTRGDTVVCAHRNNNVLACASIEGKLKIFGFGSYIESYAPRPLDFISGMYVKDREYKSEGKGLITVEDGVGTCSAGDVPGVSHCFHGRAPEGLWHARSGNLFMSSGEVAYSDILSN